MSDCRLPQIGGEISLLPTDIRLDARYNVRPFCLDPSEEEDKRIERLARSIELEGQLDACLITPQHVLIAGHRRRRAIMFANERRTVRAQSLLRVRCVVDSSTGDLRRKAIQSNVHRKDSSVMDVAYLAVCLRAEYNWGREYQGAVKVAEYMGVSPATILQAEKFLDAERELQNRLHNGAISAHSALAVMKAASDPDERRLLLERAAEIGVEEQTDRVLERYQEGRIGGPGKAFKRLQRAVQTAQAAPIRHPQVVQAIRERQGARIDPERRLALSRSELLKTLEHFDGPAYPGNIRRFVRYFVDDFAPGLGSLEELQERALAYTTAQAARDNRMTRALPN